MTKLPPDKGKGDWLVKFILKHGLVHGAELGVQKGVNLKYLLDNVPHLKMIGVDIWSEKSVRFNETKSEDLENDTSSVNYKFYQNLLKYQREVHPRLVLYRHFTSYATKFVEDASLDFAFIDAGHEYEDVKEDIINWYPKIKDGGFLLGHDINQAQVRRAVSEVLGSTWSIAKRQKIWYVKR
tara:strand:+ start:2459 stop:3004 length:546 start_codon:yes stop_codon:yes gene_type:complete